MIARPRHGGTYLYYQIYKEEEGGSWIQSLSRLDNKTKNKKESEIDFGNALLRELHHKDKTNRTEESTIDFSNMK